MSFLNGSWYNPYTDFAPLLLVIVLTIIIEAVIVASYGISQKFSIKSSIMLVIIIILANFISGLTGYFLSWVF